MPSVFSTSCPHCGKSLKVKSRRTIGKRVPCPQCGKPFVVKSVPELDEDFDDFDGFESFKDDDESFDERPVRRPQPLRRRKRKPQSRRSGSKKKPINLYMVIGGLSGLALGLMMLLGLLFGRNGREGAANSVQRPSAPTVAMTDDECAEQAQLIKTLLETGDVDGLHRKFNWDVFAAASLGDIDLTARARSEFVNEAKRTKTTYNLLKQIVESAQQSQIRILRIVTVDGSKRARFRFLLNEGGISYYDFVLQKRAAAGIQIVDIYSFFSGELLSQTFHRVFLILAAHDSRGFLDKLSQTESDYMKSLEQIVEMGKHIQRGRPAEALQVYHRLPSTVKTDRSILLLRLRAASEAANDDEYTNAIDMMRRHHPNNVALDFVSIDYYYIKNQFNQVLASIDRLDKAVGGDPYLNVMRANAYAELEQLEKVRELLHAAIQQEPTLQPAYDVAIQIEIVQEEYGRAADLLNQFEAQFGTTEGEFSMLAEYAAFLRSPEYRNRK